MDETETRTWRREVGRRMVSFVKALGGLITRYESTKRAASTDEATHAEVACDLALDELEHLSLALKQLRRSLHDAPPPSSDLPQRGSWAGAPRDSATTIPPPPG